MYEKYELAVNIIRCNVDVYGHFDVYMIPGEDGHGYLDSKAKEDIESFLKSIEGYYNNKKMLNVDYGTDLKDQNACKRFILNRVDKEKHKSIGVDWLNSFVG